MTAPLAKDNPNLSALASLRKPFLPESIGKLPKPFKKDSPKGNCPECGQYHGLPAMHLDYVGHAVTTGRLLDIDPLWTWEPVGVETNGAPALDREGNLWIRLTVCGVTRLGVGDGNTMKERIGDAIRNAAMRFGVALDLWSKEELETEHVPEPPRVDVSGDMEALKALPAEQRTVAKQLLGLSAEASGSDVARALATDPTGRAQVQALFKEPVAA